jgi:hypothetical protein
MACVAAEAIGMTAAAAAARTADGLQHQVAPVAVLAVVVSGGLVEGVALGTLQAWVLRPVMGDAAARRWALVTVFVAGLGWAVASAPAVFAPEGGQEPSSASIVAAAAGLGVLMGAALGAAQAAVLRGRVLRPWRWVGISVVGWTAAMPVIFIGATMPSAQTATPMVIAAGTVTGMLAGAALGVVTGILLPSLDGQPLANSLLLQLLSSPARRVLDRSLLGLRVTGIVTGRVMSLPVQYAADTAGFVVMPGNHQHKRWWRNLQAGADVKMLHKGRWLPARGLVLRPQEPGYQEAAATYRRRWPRTAMPADQPLVRLTWRA